MKKVLIFICGWAALILGTIGVFLPVLPTTPLVILAAMCFSASSEKTYCFLLKSRFFGPYIENYATKQGITIGAKVRGIVMLWLLLGISAVIMQKVWTAVLFSVMGAAVTTHLLLIKTKRPQDTIPAAEVGNQT